MELEQKIRDCIETQKSAGWLIDKGIWFVFRDGRNPPRVSPWGAVLISMNNSTGNFMIPYGNWWKQVLEHLQVTHNWLDTFCKGFDGELISPNWFSQCSQEEYDAFDLGKRLASDYVNVKA